MQSAKSQLRNGQGPISDVRHCFQHPSDWQKKAFRNHLKFMNFRRTDSEMGPHHSGLLAVSTSFMEYGMPFSSRVISTRCENGPARTQRMPQCAYRAVSVGPGHGATLHP